MGFCQCEVLSCGVLSVWGFASMGFRPVGFCPGFIKKELKLIHQLKETTVFNKSNLKAKFQEAKKCVPCIEF